MDFEPSPRSRDFLERTRRFMREHVQPIEDRTFKEIAADTGVNINTLLSRKRYAVQRLRERLQPMYDEFRKG